jgi:hypothetical protein
MIQHQKTKRDTGSEISTVCRPLDTITENYGILAGNYEYNDDGEIVFKGSAQDTVVFF